MSLYEKYVLPRVLNCACGTKPFNYQRQKVVPMAEGLVLEVGIGSGLNIPFYDNAKVDKVLGLDPSAELHELASTFLDALMFAGGLSVASLYDLLKIL